MKDQNFKAEVVQIAEKAVMPLQSKHYVFVVGAEDKVRQVAADKLVC